MRTASDLDLELTPEDIALIAGQAIDRDDRRVGLPDGLLWQPIEQYARDWARPAIIAAEDGRWALAYWGATMTWDEDEDVAEGKAYTLTVDQPATWRHAVDGDADLPVGFAPVRFAEVDDATAMALMED